MRPGFAREQYLGFFLQHEDSKCRAEATILSRREEEEHENGSKQSSEVLVIYIRRLMHEDGARQSLAHPRWLMC